MKPVTIITGTGRSGTSFIALAFREAGVDVPGSNLSPTVRAGLEDKDVVAVNEWILKTSPYPECRESKKLVNEFGAKMANAVDGHRVVKDPRFSFTLDAWIHADLVDRVIVTVRTPSEVDASARTVNMAVEPCSILRRIGYLSWVCDHHQVDRVPIRFPHVLQENGPDARALIHEMEQAGAEPRRARRAIELAKRKDFLGVRT